MPIPDGEKLGGELGRAGGGGGGGRLPAACPLDPNSLDPVAVIAGALPVPSSSRRRNASWRSSVATFSNRGETVCAAESGAIAIAQVSQTQAGGTRGPARRLGHGGRCVHTEA